MLLETMILYSQQGNSKSEGLRRGSHVKKNDRRMHIVRATVQLHDTTTHLDNTHHNVDMCPPIGKRLCLELD